MDHEIATKVIDAIKQMDFVSSSAWRIVPPHFRSEGTIMSIRAKGNFNPDRVFNKTIYKRDAYSVEVIADNQLIDIRFYGPDCVHRKKFYQMIAKYFNMPVIKRYEL